MADERISKVSLVYEVDKPSLDATKAASDAIKRDLVSIAGEAGKTTRVYKVLDDVSKAIGQNQSLDSLTRQFVALSKATGDEIGALAKMRVAIRDIGGSEADVRRVRRAFKELQEAQANASRTAAEFAPGAADFGGGEGGGGKFGVESLRRTGGAINQLLPNSDLGPAVQRLGDVGQVIKEIGTVSESAALEAGALTLGIGGLEIAISPVLLILVPLIAGFAAVALSIKILTDEADAARKAVEDENKATQLQIDLKDANRKAARGTSTEQNEADIGDTVSKRTGVLEAIKKFKQEKADNDKAFADLGNSFAPDTRNELGAKGQELDKTIAGYQKELADLNNTYINGTGALSDQIKIEEARVAALKAEKDAQEARNKEADTSIALAKTEAQLIASGSSKGVGAHIEDNRTEQAAITATLAGGGLSESKIAELKTRLADLGREETDLVNKILPLVILRERENKAVDDFKKTVENTVKSIEAQGKATTKYNDDVTKINENGAARVLEIDGKYVDRRVEIAAKAVIAAQDALRKLDEKQTDLGTALERDNSKAQRDQDAKLAEEQVKFQREEVKDKQDHLKRLQQIQRSTDESDQQALLDGNFTQLAKNRLAKNKALDDENDTFRTQEQTRIIAYQNQQHDEAQAIARARQDRLITYNNALADARLAYNRELAAQQTSKQRELDVARDGHTKELTALNTKITNELTARQKGYQAEYLLLGQSEAEKLKLQQAYQARAIAQLAVQALPNAASSLLGAFAAAPSAGNNVAHTWNIQAHDTQGVINEVLGILGKVIH